MPDDFDWSQIDLVIINPERSDRVMINGTVLATTAVETPLNYYWTDSESGETHIEPMGILNETVFLQAIEGEDATFMWDRRVDNISADFLNGTAQVFAPSIEVTVRTVVEYRDSEGNTFIDGQIADETDYDYDLSGAIASSAWFDFGYGARVHYFEQTQLATDWLPGSWFVYGGILGRDGTLYTGLTASLPQDF